MFFCLSEVIIKLRRGRHENFHRSAGENLSLAFLWLNAEYKSAIESKYSSAWSCEIPT